MPKSLRIALPLLALILGAACVAGAVFGILDAVRGDGVLVQVPAESTIPIPKPGRYSIWIQNQAAIDGKLMTFATNLPPDAAVEVADASSGRPIPLREGFSSTMRINNVHRRSLGYVEIPAAGELRVNIRGLEGRRLLYITESGKFRDFFMNIALGVTGVFLIIAGVVLGIYFLFRPSPRQYHPLQSPD